MPAHRKKIDPHAADAIPVYGILGSCALGCGAVLFLLILIDATGGLPFAMPRSWYVNRPIWLFLAFLAFLGGSRLLRQQPELKSDWKPEHEGIRFRRLTLYCWRDSSLGEQAKTILRRYQAYLPQWHEVDLDDLEEAEISRRRLLEGVPLVEIDGEIRFRGAIDERILRRLIESTPPLSPPEL